MPCLSLTMAHLLRKRIGGLHSLIFPSIGIARAGGDGTNTFLFESKLQGSSK